MEIAIKLAELKVVSLFLVIMFPLSLVNDHPPFPDSTEIIIHGTIFFFPQLFTLNKAIDFCGFGSNTCGFGGMQLKIQTNPKETQAVERLYLDL